MAPIDYDLSLAEASLARMRALIFELRPEALEEEGLIAALEKRVEALRVRYDIDVETGFPMTIAAPQPIQEAIYNIVKHARASNVRVDIARDHDTITLTIADDGVGFDMSGSFPGHLGLKTMADRAERLGGAFRILSASGEGSTITVAVPCHGEGARSQ